MQTRIEEIRIRSDRPISVYYSDKELHLKTVGTLGMIQYVIDRATSYSQYASQDMLRRGFLTLPGGHRLGLCGTAVYQGEHLRTLREISSINLRFAREIQGIADPVIEHLWIHPGSVLIIGPPGRGKTTLLRDLIRQLSNRFRFRISVVDERNELGASWNGQIQFDLGQTTDVLSGVKKPDGIEILLRGMNPQWIVLDEISAARDVDAMVEASYCGVLFAASAHANCREDLFSRPVYKKLMESNLFHSVVTIERSRKLKTEVLV